jgi:hypothetical protein
VRKHDRKRAAGKPKNELEVNIKMGLTEAELDDMDYSYGLEQGQMVGSHQKGNKPSGFKRFVKYFLTSCETVGFPRMTLHHAVQMTPESRAIEAV